MAISLIFSISLYQVSVHEVEQGIRRPAIPFRRINNLDEQSFLETYLQEQEEAVQAAKIRIKSNLFVINLFILVSGGFLSYYFARKTLRPIEDAHAAQARFTADASHELRTPIAAMRIENELALTDTKLTINDARKQLESNIEELDKLTNLSEGLLKLARADNNINSTKKRMSIHAIVTKAVKQITPIATKKSIHFSLNSISQSKVLVDEARTVEAIITVLDNAVKYSPADSTIYISSMSKSNYIKLTIRDEGIGIDNKHIEHIFERFYRVDDSRSKSSVGGYGIGLAVARESIEAQGGSICVKSKKHKGSTFTISLPTA